MSRSAISLSFGFGNIVSDNIESGVTAVIGGTRGMFDGVNDSNALSS